MAGAAQIVRAAASSVLSQAVARAPIAWVRPLSGVSLVVPYYHMVSDRFVPHVSHLYRFRTVAEFRGDLEFFLGRFAPVSLTDIVDSLDGRRALGRPCFHLTFDDGFREMYDVVAPILERAGVPATFFLNTAFLDGGGLAHHNALSLLADRVKPQDAGARKRILAIPYGETSLVRSVAETLEVDLDGYVREMRPYLSSEQVATLIRRDFSIGAHSHDHPLYADLSLEEQLAQTKTSIEWLEARFGLSPKAFAFPHRDDGVGPAFFTVAFGELALDVTFGTGDLVAHFHPRNIERVSMEKTAAPAARILARQFARAAYYRRLRPSAATSASARKS